MDLGKGNETPKGVHSLVNIVSILEFGEPLSEDVPANVVLLGCG